MASEPPASSPRSRASSRPRSPGPPRSTAASGTLQQLDPVAVGIGEIDDLAAGVHARIDRDGAARTGSIAQSDQAIVGRRRITDLQAQVARAGVAWLGRDRLACDAAIPEELHEDAR